MSCHYLRLIPAALLCLASVAVAQTTPGTGRATAVPRLVHFSGSFHPSANQPAGLVGATFATYSEPEGGTALWSEEQNIALDANGSYTVMLGSTKNGGVPPELFSTSDARWLQVSFHLPDEVTQPRILLVSVPYALKAADAETIGGLPPSAFVLAAPPSNTGADAVGGSESVPAATPAVSGSGTTDFVPLWLNNSGALGNSVLFQSGTGGTAQVGVNTTTPAATLDINGSATVRGTLSLPVTGTSTASSGKKSQPLTLTASSFNSSTSSAQSQTFQLQAQAEGNNTAAPSGMLHLLFGAGTSTPAQTGLKIASNGLITFAPGQTFPGGAGGTVTSVGSGAGLTGGPITGSGTLSIAPAGVNNTMLANPSLTVSPGTGLTGGGSVALGSATTLNVDTTKVPLLNAANTFTGNQTVNGNLTATGVVTGSSYQIGSSLFAFGSAANSNAFLGFSGNSATTGINNTATGSHALAANTSGSSNTADGYQALQANTTGSDNIAIGSQPLPSNTGGSDNVAIGGQALFDNTTGANNVAIGLEAMYANTTGKDNVALGVDPLYRSTTGSNNIAIGLQTLYDNNGSYNTAVGDSVMGSTTTGSYNTALGSEALFYNTIGSYNTAVGYQAGNPPTFNLGVSGYWNTFVGYNAGTNAQTAISNVTAIGANAKVGEPNALILGGTGSSAVSVGIGTATPYYDYALDVEATPGGDINGGVVSNGTGGNIYLGMTNKVHKFRVDTNGVTYADGGFQSSGADFAESFAVHGQRSQYEPGDVMEIDREANRHLTLSHHAYATLVAGVYSTKPGVLASPHHIDDPVVQQSEVPLAVVGIVPCKVTAENGAIARGDLLVASSRPGYAMKGTNRRRMLGAVIGKALEPLPKGNGIIQVLITLQ